MAIILYTIPTSEWCTKARKLLRRKRIKFEEREFLEEKKFALEVLEKTGQLALPVLDVNGKLLIGFDEEEIVSALKSS